MTTHVKEPLSRGDYVMVRVGWPGSDTDDGIYVGFDALTGMHRVRIGSWGDPPFATE